MLIQTPNTVLQTSGAPSNIGGFSRLLDTGHVLKWTKLVFKPLWTDHISTMSFWTVSKRKCARIPKINSLSQWPPWTRFAVPELPIFRPSSSSFLLGAFSSPNPPSVNRQSIFQPLEFWVRDNLKGFQNFVNNLLPFAPLSRVQWLSFLSGRVGLSPENNNLSLDPWVRQTIPIKSHFKQLTFPKAFISSMALNTAVQVTSPRLWVDFSISESMWTSRLSTAAWTHKIPQWTLDKGQLHVMGVPQ